MGDIAYQNQDITLKLLADALKKKSLAPFGLPHIKIKDALPTNLPAIEANEMRIDHLFVLEDGSLAVIDYESTYSRQDVVKYINYIARILKKYLREKPREMPHIHLIVIYSADITKISTAVCDFGCMKLYIEAAFLRKLPAKEIYSRISKKIREGKILGDEEMLELIVLPLTVRGKKPKEELAKRTIGLAKELADEKQRLYALAGLLTFTDKILDKDFANRIKEEIRMTKVAQLIFNDGVAEGIQQGIQQGIRVLAETCREFGISREEAVMRVMQKFEISQEKAKTCIDQYWGEENE